MKKQKAKTEMAVIGQNDDDKTQRSKTDTSRDAQPSMETYDEWQKIKMLAALQLKNNPEQSLIHLMKKQPEDTPSVFATMQEFADWFHGRKKDEID